MKKLFVTSIMLASIVSSCNKEEVTNPISVTNTQQEVVISTEEGNRLFARALSRALVEVKGISSTLITEAQKEFDYNLDILYHLVKDKKIENGTDIRSVIAKYWEGTPESFRAFENQSPLLNLYAADLSIFDKNLSLEQWNTQKEIAVALKNPQGNQVLYVNGDSVACIKGNEIPAIPTFVVNLNERVEVASTLRSASHGNKFTYKFVHDAYNKAKHSSLRTAYVNYEDPIDDGWLVGSELDPEVITAWNNTKNGKLSRQRAQVYYTQDSDEVNDEFDEYLYRFKIARTAYSYITGDTEKEATDPTIKTGSSFSTKTVYATYPEIISKLWTQGSFTFAFDLLTPLTSGETQNERRVIHVSPREAFHTIPNVKRIHPTLFRRTRYIYSVNPDSLKARWIYPHKTQSQSYVRVEGSWDLKTQGLTKLIRVSELDKGTIKQRVETYGTEFLSKASLSLGLKFGKIVDTFSANLSGEYKETKNVTSTTEFADKDDDLGSHKVYFTDPIINKEKIEMGVRKYMPQEYSTGSVTFVLMPLKNR